MSLRVAALCLLVAVAGLSAGQAPPPHSQPRGRRAPPVSAGEGGAVWIQAPRELCADPRNEFHLHQRVEPSGTRFIAELEVNGSACEWRFSDLAEGEYEALIQVAATGRTVARGTGEVFRGDIRLITLRSPDVRVQGFVTSEGRPRPDLALRFQVDGPMWTREANVAIGSDGWYDTLLGDPSRGENSQRYCAWLSARNAANHVVTCRELSGRWDFDVAPGGIHVEVPPFVATGTQWAHVTLRSIRTIAPGDSLVQPGGSATFKPEEGLRRDYIALPYGEFSLTLNVGDAPSAANPAATAMVTLTADAPVAMVTLDPLARPRSPR